MSDAPGLLYLLTAGRGDTLDGAAADALLVAARRLRADRVALVFGARDEGAGGRAGGLRRGGCTVSARRSRSAPRPARSAVSG